MQVSKHPRHRSASDPFTDPSALSASYSSYGVPTLTRNAPQQSHRPPPPPPKGPSKSSPPRRQYSTQPAMNQNVVEAVRDTVTVRNAEQNPRSKLGRSQTELPPVSPPRPPVPPARRSQSQDSVARAVNAADKSKSKTGNRTRIGKKGSSHADVIDRLDFSGVGPMFHHDGPFDACAPSRNRHRSKAPMFAWTSNDADEHALASAKDIGKHESPYPSPATGVYLPYEAPKKKHDAIAEAWGIHEPEPFEDFSAGGGHSTRPSGEYNASSRHGTNGTRRTRDGRDAREVYREYLEDPNHPRRQGTKRSPLPPPQPIFVGEPEEDLTDPVSPTAGPASPGNPKRTKSIMRRIRKMRDNPNMPVGADDEHNALERDPSPPSSAENSAATHASAPPRAARPTHRPQNSFLGRFGRGASTPRGDSTANALDEAYVYVEDPLPPNKNKNLPATPIKTGGTPPEESATNYFDAPGSPRDGGLGRKASLLRKVKGVVKK
ncbi:hypothetical protein OBBRIDRAFT_800045 [Obba rivulosa]|uniref:Uncharacterized protein n=1 Tax=Obba rivulosa TaxID=1052685 RepID=A0A8E2DUH0_9APHY|nr:hypothetical protein OBBRIDRAFT_800045 [Obba rivulosa]